MSLWAKSAIVLCGMVLILSQTAQSDQEVRLEKAAMTRLYGGANGKVCAVMEACKKENVCSNSNNDQTGCSVPHPYSESNGAYAWGCLDPASPCPKCDCTAYEKDLNGTQYYCIKTYQCNWIPTGGGTGECTKGGATGIIGSYTKGNFSCADNSP